MGIKDGRSDWWGGWEKLTADCLVALKVAAGRAADRVTARTNMVGWVGLDGVLGSCESSRGAVWCGVVVVSVMV